MAQNVDHVFYFKDGSLFQAKIRDGSQDFFDWRIFLTEKVSHLRSKARDRDFEPSQNLMHVTSREIHAILHLLR